MAKAIIMPKFGFSQESAQIVTWLKGEGDKVNAGEPIAEVTTDKVNMEVEATVSGILARLKYKVGDIVPVTEVIAYILQPGESVPSSDQPKSPETLVADEQKSVLTESTSVVEPPRSRIQATPVAEQFAREKGVALSHVSGSGPGGRVTRADVDAYLSLGPHEVRKVRATPGARRVANEMSVDLGDVRGSGPRGRVQGADVFAFAETRSSVSAPTSPLAASTVGTASDGREIVLPLSNTRRLIGERLQRSAQESPHIYLEVDVDTTALENLRLKANARQDKEKPNTSLTVLLLRGVAWALLRHPMLNSRLDDDGVHLLPEVNLGVAVAAESGLIVPVLRDVPHKTVPHLTAELADMVRRARDNKLRLEDISGGTFTISNLGMFGVDRFTAVINPPQAAILAVGSIRRAFVPDENDQPTLCSLMSLTLGADHRIVDGAIAARFLTDLRDVLEHPEIIVL